MEPTKIDFTTVTEISGDEVSQEQVQRLCDRYFWAGEYCRNKDVVEVACGTGQGLGYLATLAKSVEGGDIDAKIVKLANDYYRGRVRVLQMDATELPYADASKDVIILFEAIYYLPDAEKFIGECQRVLRPGGRLLIATANKDLPDFNPSPYSHRYFGVAELNDLLGKRGFTCEFFGHTNVSQVSWKQKILRPVKKVAVGLNLIPKTMAAKKLLKRFVFGQLVKMPSEIKADLVSYQKPVQIPSDRACLDFKVVLCAASWSGVH